MTQQPISRDDIKDFLLNGLSNPRGGLKDSIRAKLEEVEPPQADQPEADDQLPAGEPHALNSYGLLNALGSKLGFDATTMTTFTSRERGLDNPL